MQRIEQNDFLFRKALHRELWPQEILDPHTDPASAIPGVGAMENKVDETISIVGKAQRETQLRASSGQGGMSGEVSASD